MQPLCAGLPEMRTGDCQSAMCKFLLQFCRFMVFHMRVGANALVKG